MWVLSSYPSSKVDSIAMCMQRVLIRLSGSNNDNNNKNNNNNGYEAWSGMPGRKFEGEYTQDILYTGI